MHSYRIVHSIFTRQILQYMAVYYVLNVALQRLEKTRFKPGNKGGFLQLESHEIFDAN